MSSFLLSIRVTTQDKKRGVRVAHGVGGEQEYVAATAASVQYIGTTIALAVHTPVVSGKLVYMTPAS